MTRSDSQPKPPALLVKIDWYSFTIPLPAPLSGDGPDSLEVVNRALRQLPLSGLDEFSPDGTWRLDNAKGFYAFRAVHLTSGLSASWGEINPHLFVELPGGACSYFQASGDLSTLIARTSDRAARIDAAIDIFTKTTPEDFVSKGHAARFKDSVANIKSLTGETFYVGSRKSDRCARVYRYHAPHPRAHLLRVEAEYKHDDAKALATLVAKRGQLAAIASAHAVFEWGSDEMDLAFLVQASCRRGLPTSPVTGNIDGSWRPYFPHYGGISPLGWWTWPDGFEMLSLRRWNKRPRLVR